MSNLIDPSLFASTPYDNRTALLDYYGLEAIFHRELVRGVRGLTQIVYPTYPLGDGGGQRWLEVHNRELVGACAALGIPFPADLTQYDLTDATDFASYMFLCSQEHIRIGRAAGIL